MQLLLFRKNHARLACSVVNALTTARCRYQLLRILDSRKGCPYGSIYFSICAKHPLLFTLYFSLFSACQNFCHRPTVFDICLRLVFFRLQGKHFGIHAATAYQFLVRAGLDNFAVFHNVNSVGDHGCRKPVRN